MTSTVCATACCIRPADDAFICKPCGDHLARRLGEVPALVEDLQVAVTRQARMGGGKVGGRAAEKPLPFHSEASEAAWGLANVLGTWVREIAEHVGANLDLTLERVPAPVRHRADPANPSQGARDTASRASRWLLRYIETIRLHPAAEQIYEEITDAAARAEQVVDRPRDRTYAGPCDGIGATFETDIEPCGNDLLGQPEMSWVRCRVCSREYDVAERQQWMRDDLADQLGSSLRIATLATALGVKVSDVTIRSWVQRKKLRPKDWVPSKNGGEPKPLYRLGDVVDVAAGVTIAYTA